MMHAKSSIAMMSDLLGSKRAVWIVLSRVPAREEASRAKPWSEGCEDVEEQGRQGER